MQIKETKLDGVWLIKPDVHTDFRGDYVMIHHLGDYDALLSMNTGVNRTDLFREWDIATSRKGVFRGIHYSPHCWKIYQCLHGSIYYVFVNCDKNDEKFGEWASFQLEPYDQILKHPKYGAGMLALEDDTILHYAQTQYYDANAPDQETFRIEDFPDVFVPNYRLILSERDTKGHYIEI